MGAQIRVRGPKTVGALRIMEAQEGQSSKQMMKIEGVGSVRFKLHDGSVKTDLNVKYVQGAARNILSLGVLTSHGYRYVGRKDTCKVYKRDQLVIRGWKILNNLCYLEGEALQGRTFCRGNKRWFEVYGDYLRRRGVK
ncbi:hypothetical protein Tco_1022989 [Tanacetum coccineum]